jgi:hypothetical protein
MKIFTCVELSLCGKVSLNLNLSEFVNIDSKCKSFKHCLNTSLISFSIAFVDFFVFNNN